MVDRLALAWFRTLSALQAKPRCLLDGSTPWVLPSPSAVAVVPRPGLIAWYIRRETRTVTYPTEECTLDVQALRKVSTEVPNMSKGEMHFNFSLSISV
jgi:hypothetical protein